MPEPRIIGAARQCFWVPDYSWISLLKPAPGYALSISAPMQLIAQDAANQTLAASTVGGAGFTLNTLVPGTWVAPGANQAVLFENIGGSILVTDNSGKIQILNVTASLGDNFTNPALVSTSALPFTFPALLNNIARWVTAQPVPLMLPRPTPSANGPAFGITLLNTDGAASHTYKRTISLTFRLIGPCDFSSGPVLPGSGEQPI